MNTAEAKALIAPWRQALYNFDAQQAHLALRAIAGDACFHMCYPFGDLNGAAAFYATAVVPLTQAWPDFERRDYIVMAGEDLHGLHWVATGGYYTGTFLGPWLDIAPTGHQAHMRFHEFYQIQAQQVVQAQILWDIPALMMQAGVWPMAPSLGLEWAVPAPATQDGLQITGTKAEALTTCKQVMDMLECMQRHPQQGPEAMQMERFWHPRMNWYGPAGIGTARGIAGFRHWHQIPFLHAMPDRGQYADKVVQHLFAEGQYAAVTGWPSMMQTLSGDGWLGLPPVHQQITLRSLDFWRLECGKIRENWVLIDLLDVYCQLGVDVIGRMREFNKARNLHPLVFEKDY